MIDRQDIQQKVTRLKRATNHSLTLDVCEAVDKLLARVSQLEAAVSQVVSQPVSQEPTVSQKPPANGKRNRTEYMREYMRKHPEKRKAKTV